MKIKVALFAVAKDLAEASELEIELPDNSNVSTLKSVLVEQVPKLKEIVDRSMIAIDHEFAAVDTTIRPHQEIALIPPVSGG